jgi:hypothetical protein
MNNDYIENIYEKLDTIYKGAISELKVMIGKKLYDHA